jgi:membrane protease YdiL (CAAX protease family)
LNLDTELKQQEIKDFKRILYLLAITVMAVTLAQKLLSFLISSAIGLYIASLPAVPAAEAAAAAERVISDSALNFLYLIEWTLSHFIIFTPALIIFGLAFRKKLFFEKAGEPYEFNAGWILPIFLASYALSYVASFVSHFIAWVLEPVFGGGGLPDIFGEIMPRTSGQFIIMLIMVGFIGPILEEYIYRHLLLRPLRRFGDFQAVLITALLFGFFHGNFTQFLYTFAGGVIYGIVAVKANSVKPAVVLHIINNVYIIVYAELDRYMNSIEDFEASVLTHAFPWIVLGAGAVFFIYFAVSGKFRTENYNPHISASERVRITAENPLILLMFVVLIIQTIAGTA